MEYNDFIQFIQEALNTRLNSEVEVKYEQILKNNSLVLDALIFSKKNGIEVAPIIYLNELYDSYQKGMSIPKIINEIEKICNMFLHNNKCDVKVIFDFEKVKSKILCKIVNYDRNIELLKTVPHMKVLDLAIVFYCLIDNKPDGIATFLVYNEHMDIWGITLDKLINNAVKNTVMNHPCCKNVRDICEKHNIILSSNINAEVPMYVLTNQSMFYGAVYFMFNIIMKDIAKRLNADLWVLPSSIHECIILPDSEKINSQDLVMMVREINEEYVIQEEVLSDNIYFYHKDTNKLDLIKRER